MPPHEILEETRRDQLGIVYRARDPARDAFVLLHAANLAEAAEGAARFLQEVRAAARLRLPCVLPIRDAGVYDRRPCFTTDLPPQTRLSNQRERFADPRAAAGLVEKLARGVAAAHAHGLVHGHLQSDIIYLDADGQPLIDFFTLPFFLHLPTGSAAAADVSSLGVVLYELLAGRNPSVGLPPELEAVVLCCLQKRPDDRYPSARALAEDLEHWLRAEPTVARPMPWWRRALSDLWQRYRRNAR